MWPFIGWLGIPHMWPFIGGLGLVLQLGGLGIALWGLDQLSSELFPGHPLPHKAAWRWVKRRLGIKPHTQRVQLEGAAVAAGDALAAHALVTKRRPSDDAPLTEWNMYWDSRLKNVSDQITWLQEGMMKADNDLAERLNAERAERHTAVARLEERLKVVVGGEGGSGLVWTWRGLLITAVGVLFQGLAQSLG